MRGATLTALVLALIASSSAGRDRFPPPSTTGALGRERSPSPPHKSSPPSPEPTSPPPLNPPSPPPGDVITCLQSLNLPKLTLPADADFYYEKQLYNKRFDSHLPLAVASVASEAQIMGALRCAHTFGVTAQPKNGGHSFEGYSVLDGSIVINLRPYFIDVTVDTDHGNPIAYAQSGAHAGDLLYAAWNAGGLGGVTGTHPTVGLSGLTLGGGYGFLSRREGLACDRIKSLRMVTWDGRVVEASEERNKDLFWASCGGGGGNFGIVTLWAVRLARVPAFVESAELSVPNAQTLAMFRFWQTWARTAHPAWGMNFKINRNPGFVEMYYIPDPTDPNPTTLEALINESGLLSVDPALTMPTITKLTWLETVYKWANWGMTQPSDLVTFDNTPRRVARREKSFVLYQPLSDAAIIQIKYLLTRVTGLYRKGSLQIHPQGGAVSQKADDDTAYPHRSALGVAQAIARWDTPAEEAAASQWLEDLQAIIAGEQPHYGYVNYLDEHPALDWRLHYYRNNYARLLEVKEKYDRRKLAPLFHQAIGACPVPTIEIWAGYEQCPGEPEWEEIDDEDNDGGDDDFERGSDDSHGRSPGGDRHREYSSSGPRDKGSDRVRDYRPN